MAILARLGLATLLFMSAACSFGNLDQIHELTDGCEADTSANAVDPRCMTCKAGSYS